MAVWSLKAPSLSVRITVLKSSTHRYQSNILIFFKYFNQKLAKMANGLSSYDIAKDMKDFEETKAGVKGLVDTGLTKLPRMFIQPADRLSDLAIKNTELRVPVIDFEGIDQDFRRPQIVKEVREACETWGFFQMVNHGVPEKAMDKALEGSRRFHEQPKEDRMDWYSRDYNKKVTYYSSVKPLATKAAVWRDSVGFDFLDGPLDPENIPSVCREAVQEYTKHMNNLGNVLSGLLSEALGLSADYLERREFLKADSLVLHYSPSCPEPKLTLNTSRHTDPSSFTVVLQDKTGGLQVLHEGHWVDVPPTKGTLVANVGDLLQFISNGRFKSVVHRVLAGTAGPRVSAVCFFYPSATERIKPIGPIKEILSGGQPIYREVSVGSYLAYFRANGFEGKSVVPDFELAPTV